MELKWLDDFLVLAREGNFRVAAGLRGVSQPAFSRRIQALEIWIGTQLIDRGCQPSHLTEAGKVFQPVAQKIVDLAKSGKCAAQDLAREETEKIRFATLGTLSQIFIPGWLKSLQPYIVANQFVVKIQFGTIADYFKALEDNTVDFFISYLDPRNELLDDVSNFSAKILASEILVPVVSPNEDGSPRWWLSDQPEGPIPCLHTLSDNSPWPIKKHMERTYGSLNFKSVYESSLGTTLRGMAVEGFGVAWLPLTMVREDLARGLLVRAADPVDDIAVNIKIYRSVKNNEPRVERFWKALSM